MDLKEILLGRTGEPDMDASAMNKKDTMRPTSTPPKDMSLPDCAPSGNLDFGSRSATPNDMMLLMGASKPYKMR